MSEHAAPVFHPEKTSATISHITPRVLALAAAARQPKEDGYPVSGDMLAVVREYGPASTMVRARRRALHGTEAAW